jgi:hypothetical protein
MRLVGNGNYYLRHLHEFSLSAERKDEDWRMATTVMADSRIAKAEPEVQAGVRNIRRRISPQAGRALEILGHAIDYLTDEYFHESGSPFVMDGRVEALQMLMAVNRQVYFECPEAPTLRARWRTWRRERAA